MEQYKKALGVLESLTGHVDGLGPSIDVLQRLSAGHAHGAALQGIMDQLPLHARLAVVHRGNPGAAEEVRRMVGALEQKFTNMRELQARRSFEAFGPALGASSFKEYLSGTDKLEGIREIPAFSPELMSYFDETLLVDGRILEGHEKSVGMVETCRLAKLVFGGSDDTLVSFDPKRVMRGLRWVRFQDGRRNHGRTPSDCRRSFVPIERGADAMTGIARFVQDELVLWKHFMDCTGSVGSGGRGYCACLGVWGAGPELRWHWDDGASPVFGSASCGE